MQGELERETSGVQDLEAQRQVAQDRLQEMDQQRAKLEDKLNDMKSKYQMESQKVSSQTCTHTTQRSVRVCVRACVFALHMFVCKSHQATKGAPPPGNQTFERTVFTTTLCVLHCFSISYVK